MGALTSYPGLADEVFAFEDILQPNMRPIARKVLNYVYTREQKSLLASDNMPAEWSAPVIARLPQHEQ